jgi:hypothetical protein
VQALGLSGQKLLGVPVVIQPSQAEKNRVGNYSDPMVRPEKGPMKLYIGSLHFNITEDMLKGEKSALYGSTRTSGRVWNLPRFGFGSQ